MSFIAKHRRAARLAPLFLAGATLFVAAQTLAARADSEDSRLFYASPGPGHATLDTQAAPQAQPAAPAEQAPAPAPQPVVRAERPVPSATRNARAVSAQDQALQNALRAQDSMRWRAYSEVY